MKLAIMTWYHYRNYGTALQVAALSEKLRKIGHEPEVIRYKPTGYFRTIPDYTVKLVVNRVLNRLGNSHAPAYSRAYSTEAKDKLFEAFLDEHISFSDKCETLSDLEELNGKYDAFVCGSDQIWSPLCFDPHYFLDFVKNPAKKIAYAPSMGASRIDDKYIAAETKKLLDNFAHISVRETTGQSIIKGLTGITPKVTADPTILFTGEEWKNLLELGEPTENEPYMFVYMLGKNARHWELIKSITEKLKLRIKMVPVFEDDVARDGCISTPVGPKEFLKLLYNASYVCTDSFHGLVFSLLFHKRFSIFSRFQSNDPQNQNSRVLCLLDRLNLQSRLIDKNYSEGYLEQNIDFLSVDDILQKEREQSIEYLSGVLREAEMSQNTKTKHVLEQNSLCCGCGACAAVCVKDAVKIIRNENGFYSVQIDVARCADCGRCIAVCPFCGKTGNENVRNTELFSFKSADKNILMSSTSGGAAYYIAQHLLQQGYYVVGCTFDRQSQTAKHILIKSESELDLIQGSKYLQSAFKNALCEALASERPVAVFGTPCQVAAARRVLKGKKDNVYVDLVCHGVPSYHLYEKYGDYLQRKAGIKSEKMQMVFRYKPEGWRSIHLFATDDEHSNCNYKSDDPFFRMFEVGSCYMKTCYECRWRAESEADIRLGDYWGPRFENDRTGVSMVIACSEKGKNIVRELADTCKAEIEEHSIEEYITYQQQKNLPKPVFYDNIMRALQNKKSKIEDIADKYAVPFENRTLSGKERIKHVAKMLRVRNKI
jgi:coenzyme F420-reducing hydrogenase beta subunit